MTLEIKKPTQRELDAMASNIRSADKKEVLLCSNMGIKEALHYASTKCDDFKGLYLDNILVCVFGVSECERFGDGTGVPFMLCTQDIKKVKTKDFMDLSVETVRSYLTKYKRLYNYTLSDNYSAKRFIKALGFKFGRDVVNIGNYIFEEFSLCAHPH